MDIIISNSGGVPIYDQITRQMKGLILRGELKEGEALPSMRLLAKELLIPTDKMAKAVETIAKEMEASRYHIRTPAFWDGLPGSYTQAFGMIKWYDPDKRALWGADTQGYMGLGFD